jgi:hypothetical protein
MSAFTILTASATQGSDAVEVSTLSDDFSNDSEALGYSRRMAEEMVGMAHQLALDFDFSTVGVYEGDLIDEEIDPSHPAFLGAWVLDEQGVAFVGADEYREGEGLAEAPIV